MSTSKTSETYSALKGDLLNGRFRPGEQLRIDAISAVLGVSKGAVREALARLTSDGLVENTPQKGFVVTAVSSEDLVDLTEVRIELECQCLEQSIAEGDLTWEGRVLSAYHLLSNTRILSDSGSVNPDWTRRHDDFHNSLISACKSRWRLRLREMTYLQAERYRRMMRSQALGVRDVDAEHNAIMRAALDRNAPLASNLMAHQLRTTAEYILSSGVLTANAPEVVPRKSLRV